MSGPPLGACAGGSPGSLLLPVACDPPGGLGRGGELPHRVVPGVEGVDHLEIRDEQRNVAIEHLRLDDDELPFLVHVHIAEKVRDDIR